jgi:hypothetical protein
MSVSRAEELIAGVYLIAALLAFIGGYPSLGWALAVKAALDAVCAICYAVKEVKEQPQWLNTP